MQKIKSGVYGSFITFRSHTHTHTVQDAREAKVDETWLRQWLSREVGDGPSSSNVVSVLCVDGRLAVSVDKSSLQVKL